MGLGITAVDGALLFEITVLRFTESVNCFAAFFLQPKSF
jgi:hypothetical protein